jgi:hypothetical protein
MLSVVPQISQASAKTGWRGRRGRGRIGRRRRTREHHLRLAGALQEWEANIRGSVKMADRDEGDRRSEEQETAGLTANRWSGRRVPDHRIRCARMYQNVKG